MDAADVGAVLGIPGGREVAVAHGAKLLLEVMKVKDACEKCGRPAPGGRIDGSNDKGFRRASANLFDVFKGAGALFGHAGCDWTSFYRSWREERSHQADFQAQVLCCG